MKPIVFTRHAEEKLARRGLPRDWIEEAVRNPAWIEPDPFDPEVERRFRPVAAFGDRVLRVAVVETATAIRVISAFFDRGAGRKR